MFSIFIIKTTNWWGFLWLVARYLDYNWGKYLQLTNGNWKTTKSGNRNRVFSLLQLQMHFVVFGWFLLHYLSSNSISKWNKWTNNNKTKQNKTGVITEMMMKKICTHQSIVWAGFFWLVGCLVFAITVLIVNSNFPWKWVTWFIWMHWCCSSSSCNRTIQWNIQCLTLNAHFIRHATRGTLFWISIHNITNFKSNSMQSFVLHSIIRLLAVITFIHI